MRETQLLKGVLEGCVLEMIAQEEIYGYELVQKLRQSGFENMVGGTIYPLLQKLEKKGYIRGQIKPSPDGPDRKYFTITRDGEIYLTEFWQEWSSLVEKVEQFQKRSI
ncbi:PadR family transcriptional regulator [Streptococcus pluranimalium]|uniref:PadR family transcriptional regulator n=1 Tax=Streptococcus pluranimalium TaxID=82348 RepID=UPI0024153F1E|nr:PadR family transcriptional regulator [Streptococcus pluranimalium]WFM79437.1 PadR family transcriptional regulator [Streptococcus pluranimalium]